MLFLCFILLQNGFWPRAQGAIYIIQTTCLPFFEFQHERRIRIEVNWSSLKKFLLYEKAFYYLFTLEVSTCFFVAFASTSSLLRTSLLLLHMWYAFITGPYTPYVGLTPYSQPTKGNYKRSPTPFLLAMSIDRLTEDN